MLSTAEPNRSTSSNGSSSSPPSPSSIELPSFPASAPASVKDDTLQCGGVGLNEESLHTVEQVTKALRILAADAVEEAESGHPGMPLGMAPTAATLWHRHMRFNPSNPTWINRDRFVLSAGHGSILLYSLLHVYGFESVGKDDLMRFRKLGSRTAGHPENILTPGVEVTTGALGQGISNAVGLALAESHLAATYNRPDAPPIIDHYTFSICGDGCLMEGVAAEACSLAGHWKLGKLIVFYDDNSISIEGSTDLAFTEDVPQRFRSYGWQVLQVPDGNTDIRAIHAAIVEAKATTDRPTLIVVTTTIGYGAPSKEGTAAAHGSCLGKENIASLREMSDWRCEPFEVPSDVLTETRQSIRAGEEHELAWRRDFHEYRAKYPTLASQFERYLLNGDIPDQVWDSLANTGSSYTSGNESEGRATRALSHAMINTLAAHMPHFLGGSADLGPSNLSTINKEADYSATSRGGRNLHFGVREHAMGSITNGLALYTGTSAGLVPYCATFLVFSDYMRAAIRTAALSQAGTLFVMTHDSVFLGEDGPTHQPVEHLWSFRSMPNVLVFRPADGVETAAAYEVALRRRRTPSLLALSRQRFGVDGAGSRVGALRGGYVHSDGGAGLVLDSDTGMTEAGGDEIKPDVVLIATGSELGLASSAARRGRAEGIRVRVVSMPCIELFEEQDEDYKQEVLGRGLRERTVVVEAGATGGWWRYATRFLTVDRFGTSAPCEDIRAALGLTEDRVMSLLREAADSQ